MKPTFDLRKKWRTTTALFVVSTLAVATAGYAANGNKKDPSDSVKTASPIKHVIVLIGENRGLDHTFGVYKPKGKGETISNLLSKGIVQENGIPGKNFDLAQQFSVAAQSAYYIGAPKEAKSIYNPVNVMPQPNTNGAPMKQTATGAPFQNVAEVTAEKDVNPGDLVLLTIRDAGSATH